MIESSIRIPMNVRNQGNRGTCVAFAITGIKNVAVEKSLSPEYAYLATAHQSPDWEPNKGLDIRIAITATEDGIPQDIDYPYQQTEPSRPLPKLPTDLPLHCRSSMTYKDFNTKIVKQALNEGRPVGTIIALTHSFMYPKNGIVRHEEKVYTGFHAIVIAGYGYDKEGNEYYLICNSWGDSWGDQGYAWLPDSYFSCHASCIYGEF